MTAYGRGDYHEKRVSDHLQDDGYTVWQTRGSKSAADLLAVKDGQLLLVQVKSGRAKMSHAGWNDLHQLAVRCGAVPVVADRPSRGAVRYRRILGLHKPNSQHWPAEPFTTDEVIA